MVGFIDKLKQQFEIWKIEKYTKRRNFLPEYDSKGKLFVYCFQKVMFMLKSDIIDKEYYERYYRDGVYYAATDNVPPLPSETFV